MLTIVLIGVIICRLTRKEDEKYAASQRPSSSVDEDLRNDINSRYKEPPEPKMPLPVNGHSTGRSDGKEWYV